MYISERAKQWHKEKSKWWILFIVCLIVLALTIFTGGSIWLIAGAGLLFAIPASVIFTYTVIHGSEVREGERNIRELIRQVNADPNLTDEQRKEIIKKATDPDSSIMGDIMSTLGEGVKGLVDGLTGGLSNLFLWGALLVGGLIVYKGVKD